jgi:hypothetical protein
MVFSGNVDDQLAVFISGCYLRISDPDPDVEGDVLDDDEREFYLKVILLNESVFLSLEAGRGEKQCQ